MNSLGTVFLNKFQNAAAEAGPDETKRNPWFVYLGILLLYLTFRLIAWHNTTILEDNDSLYYLLDIKNFLEHGLAFFFSMHVDMTPFYPLWGAFFSLPGWSVEVGARLTSLVFSVVLFFAILGIGRKIVSSAGIILALSIISIHAVFIPFSISILTEPSYVAVAYLGLWLFWRQHKNPTPSKAVLLGIVFGLCFLNRTEGLLFIATIPAFQLVHYFFVREKSYNFKQAVVWSLLFVTTFGLLNLPQVMRVSNKLGFFAINGRQLWVLMLNNPDGKSDEQKIWGLDYSPTQVNILYAQNHPEVVREFESSISLIEYAKTAKQNLKVLVRRRLFQLLGLPGILFFCFGLMYLLFSRRFYDLFLVVAFISTNLAGPFIHDVNIRHIAVIGPIMLLMQGVGVVYFSKLILQFIKAGKQDGLLEKSLPYALLIILLGLAAKPVWKSLHPPSFNDEYSVEELEEPLAVIREESKSLNREPRVVARWAHLPFFANGICFYIPYTDYEGLVRYCYLNDVDYLYFLGRKLKDHEYYDHFMHGETPELELMYSGVDAHGELTRLYKFDRTKYLTQKPSLGAADQ